MTEVSKKTLLKHLDEALTVINAAEYVLILGKQQGKELTSGENEIGKQLSDMWFRLFQMRKFFKDGLESTQSKGEPEKTA